MNNTAVREFLFSNYVELSRKKCLGYAICIAGLCFIFLFCFSNRLYKFFSVGLSVIVIIWTAFLMFSKKRNLPEYKFANDGVILAYLSFQFLYLAYALLYHEKKPSVFLLLLLLWGGCSLASLHIIKRKMQKGTKKYSEIWNYLNPLIAILGLIGAKMSLPKIEYTTLKGIGIVLSLLLPFPLGCICAANIYKAILSHKYHITTP